MFNLFTGLIAPGIIIIPIIISWSRRKYWQQPERIIFMYLMCSVFFNCLSVFTANMRINNLPFLHLYTILEFWIVAAFFREIYLTKKVKAILLVLITAFAAFAVVYVAVTGSLLVYNAGPRFLSSLIITFLCIRFLVVRVSEPDPDNPTLLAFSHFNVLTVFGLLLYFSTCSTLFGLSNYFFRYNNDIHIDTAIWNLHSVFMLIMYLVFAAAYITVRKR